MNHRCGMSRQTQAEELVPCCQLGDFGGDSERNGNLKSLCCVYSSDANQLMDLGPVFSGPASVASFVKWRAG